MTRTVLYVVLVIMLVTVMVDVLRRGDDPERSGIREQFPWQVALTSQGSARIFGVTLGQTTVAEAERQLRAAAEVALFVSARDEYAVEAFLDNVRLANMPARIVLTIAVPTADILAMYQRGARISTLGDGARKVRLSHDDLQRVRDTAVTGLTYMPRMPLDPALIEKRFGPPVQRIRETESGVVHWLYPAIGLDIALSDGRQDILQYVSPRDFPRLLAPLQQHGEPLP
jgi:hypothetical protein